MGGDPPAPNHIDNMTLRVGGLRWHGRPRFARCPPSLELLAVAMLCLRSSATRFAGSPLGPWHPGTRA